MAPTYVYNLRARRLPQSIGGKAEQLCVLIRHGFRVPTSFVCTWEASERYRAGDPELEASLRSELRQKLDPDRHYAVRSSANIEDGHRFSFAGQFKTLLGVRGVDNVLRALQAIWAATVDPGVRVYLDRNAIEPSELRMAVIIQEMVQPVMSGVSFSRNPLTGLDEVIVEAVDGSGDALVQEGATPMRWVNKWGTWITTPDGQDSKLEIIEEIRQQTREIAKVHGRPVDLEWVHNGHTLNWVQLREITALETPVYSNRISSEVFPGIIKPLVWSVNVPLVNGAWVRLLGELIGPNDLRPERLAARFYSRAYFSMGTLGQVFELLGLPRESLELLMGIEVEGPERPSFRPSPKTWTLLPGMLRFALNKVGFARRIEAFLPDMKSKFESLQGRSGSELSEEQILEEIDRLYPLAQKAAYTNIVTQLLMHVYNRLLKQQCRSLDVEFESFDLTAGMKELDQFDPNVHLAHLYQLYNALDEDVQARIRDGSREQLYTLSGAEALQQGIVRFLEQFGHLSDSGNDFSCEPWHENPDLILQMIANYAPLQVGTVDRVRFEDLQISPLRRPIFKTIYDRARSFRCYREAVSSLYTFGYGLFRDYFLALADCFVRRGMIAHRDEIFYLYMDEVRQIVETGRLAQDCQALVWKRRDEIDRVRDMVPPDTIYGDNPPPLDTSQGKSLKGVPTSQGSYTGRAKVLRGIQDMDRLQEGDVLVIPYSDVSWTLLFAKAGAVIAESGGILSHSSIIAREYGIPAVVSVPGACQMTDGKVVTVDAFRGEIMIHELDQAAI